jgi:hypothetical protein
MTSPSPALPSQEELLKLIDDNGGIIKDTRDLWKSPTPKPSWEDVTASDEYFNRRAAWQVSLTGVLNSLRSRDVSVSYKYLVAFSIHLVIFCLHRNAR